MRRYIWIVLSLVLWPHLAAAQSVAGCAGIDLLAQLRADDPGAHQALFRRAHAVPNGRGKFWRVTRASTDGGGTPSYLFGTFHDTEIARMPLDPTVEAALGAARLVMVEMTPEEQARMEARIASDPGFIIDPSRTGFSGQFTAVERATVERKLAANGLTLAIADKLRPWMLFALIGIPQCMLREMQQGQPMLDVLLTSKAAAAGIPVAGLETYEQALGGFDTIDEDTLNEILLDGLRNISSEQDSRRTAVELYLSGEIAAIWEFGIRSAGKSYGMARSRKLMEEFSAALLDTRNDAWMTALVPQLELGGVFAAFGALHLGGEAGVIALLRARGFEVVRLDR